MKSKWPTLAGRLSQPLTTRKEALLQLKNSGMELTPRAQKELDKLMKKDRKPVCLSGRQDWFCKPTE